MNLAVAKWLLHVALHSNGVLRKVCMKQLTDGVEGGLR